MGRKGYQQKTASLNALLLDPYNRKSTFVETSNPVGRIQLDAWIENTLDRKSSLPRMELNPRQDSSAVEQGTHKPLAGSSILPPGKKIHT